MHSKVTHLGMAISFLLLFSISCYKVPPQETPKPVDDDPTSVAGVETSLIESANIEQQDLGSKLSHGDRIGIMEQVLMNAMGSSWYKLRGPVLPAAYQDLLDSGSLPIIFKNPYTGIDISVTDQYSPGDIYIVMPTYDSPTRMYRRYLGEQDYYYNPSLEEDEILIDSPPVHGSTDGLSVTYEETIEPDSLEYLFGDNAESQVVPPDSDTARMERMAVLASVTELLILKAGSTLPNLPDTLDGYIDLVGRKNPIAWTNPYTFEEIGEVDWLIVPAFHPEDGIDESILVEGELDEITPDGFAGNYSFSTGYCPLYPESDMNNFTACAMFYFYLPDGQLAGWLVLGPARPRADL